MAALTLEEAKDRAERARRILEDPMVKETLSAAHEALINSVGLAKNEGEAYKAAIALQVFNLIVDSLKAHLETAKIIEYNFTNKKRFGIF